MTKTTKNSQKQKGLSFPASVLTPIRGFLQEKLATLEKRKKVIEEDDPFEDTSRLLDNASPDTDAAEQFGHARVEAIRGQIDRRTIQIRKALSRIKIGKYGICENCGEMIDTDRLMIYPEATLCVKCGIKKESKKGK